jgi:small GTP-binding protein
MDEENIEFKNNISYRLEKLSPEQRGKFSWLCAVRALPFLGEKRNFDYWEEESKQKLLFLIFRCIDTSADVYRLGHIGKIFDAAAAAFAATAAETYAHYATAATYAAAAAATTAATHAAAAYFMNKGKHDNQLYKIFYSDIDKIENGTDEFDSNLNIYGETWQNFLDDLEAAGCGYWGNLYKELFNNKFKFDEEELKLRLSVLDEIKYSGAKDVAKHIITIKKQGAADVQRARLILIGSAGAGKTTLARKLENENAKLTGYDSTHGVNRDIELNINGVITQIWDFGGQVIYHASHRCFMSKRCVYALVVNARKNDDYRDIGKIKYWIDTVKDYAKQEAKIFIVINEEDDRKYNFDDVQDSLKAEYKDLIHNIYSFNIGSDKKSFLNFKAILSEYIEYKGRQKIGANDKKALDDINSEFKNGMKLLGKSTIDEILAKHGIDDKERALDLFNTLGAALQYENFNDFVIDPYWISHGIYKVIDYMQDPQFKQPLYAYKLKKIFEKEGDYPEDKLNYIFELMVQNKIGFRNSGLVQRS